MAQGLRISIIGGGSAYTPGLVQGLLRLRGQIPVERLVLMDIDREKLDVVGALVETMLRAEMPGCALVLTTDRAEAIRGLDFILCQIRVGGLRARHLDEKIAMDMGLLGQETTGAGGFSMALRTIPVMLDIARDVERLNPDAWLVNYSNPTGLVADAIQSTCPVKEISICDAPMILQEGLAGILGVPPDSLFMDYFGLNHLGWARAVYLRGKDVLPGLRDALAKGGAPALGAVFGPEVSSDPKSEMEMRNALRLFQETGLVPSPYIQYYAFTDEVLEHQRESGKTRAQEVMEFEASLLTHYRQVASGTESLSMQRGGRWHADMMIGLLFAIAQDTRTVYIVNAPNRGSMPELGYEKVVEAPAVVGASGAHLLAVGKMPVAVRGLVQSVAAYEEMTVAAALTGDRTLARDALAAHPLVGSVEKAGPLLDAYLLAHQEYLPLWRKG